MNSTRPLAIAVGLILSGQSATLSLSALEAGGDWRYVRCGQHWDARLATVAAYASWTVDRVDRRVTDDSPEPALVGSLPTERAGGRP